MSVYHQMGHQSSNLITDPQLGNYKGAILSPVNEDETQTKVLVENFKKSNFELIFDPQLYYPSSHRGKLSLWDYFPRDVDTADHTSKTWYRNINNDLVNTVNRLKINHICSPSVVPRIYSDAYYQMNNWIADDLSEKIGDSANILETLIVRLSDLSNPDRSAEISSIVSSGCAKRIFMIFYSDLEPRRELNNSNDLSGAIRLIRYLEDAGINVLVGYCSSEIILWKKAGAKDCASGKFFNLRRFTPSRWEPRSSGGGQIPYWFEESLLSYLREPDLLRLHQHNLLPQASLENPFGACILNNLNSTPENPWLRLSWRQYLYWFADFESRIVSSKIDPEEYLLEVENSWNQICSKRILFEEMQNDGNWIRQWRRAIIESE